MTTLVGDMFFLRGHTKEEMATFLRYILSFRSRNDTCTDELTGVVRAIRKQLLALEDTRELLESSRTHEEFPPVL